MLITRVRCVRSMDLAFELSEYHIVPHLPSELSSDTLRQLSLTKRLIHALARPAFAPLGPPL